MKRPFAVFAWFVFVLGPLALAADPGPRIKVLFLGDNGHHKPADRFAQLATALKERGIDLTYTDKTSDLNEATLNGYDGLMVYANTTQISPEQEKAMVDYVQAGHGFLPIHCASYCFHNSPKYIAMVGGQFQKHKTGTFDTKIVDPNHPIMKGFKPFTTWDETYVHTKLAGDIELLQVRPESVEGGYGGDREEPWTWTRSEGKGRVFYTAYGHDQRTFGNAGFVDLIDRGVRWAVRRDPLASFENPKLVGPDPSAKAFEYIEADGIPFYDPTGKGPARGGGKWNKMPKPLAPAESMKHMVLPEGFEAKLFAAEPDIIKPLWMTWDERGRLWIGESIDYPNRVTDPGKGSDRIKICEDTDGDGKADKFTVFAMGLNIPTSLAFWNGGVIVHERKSTWFMKDTDGDGKADVKKELFTGWYRGLDTHAGPSNLQYGLDNWIWGMLGYAGFEGSVGGKSHKFSQGFYRFKPDGSQLEFVRSTNNNTWGIGFSEDGLVFGSTANGNPSCYMPIPNRYYEAVRGWSPEVLRPIADSWKFKAATDKVRQVDWHNGYTAAAGHALYTARAYPKEYWNRTAFVTEPTGHLVGTFVLDQSGTDFKSRNPFNLFASVDEWCAPIMAEVGPDGFVWMIDWYNYIVQHNPTPVGYRTGEGNAYETPRRDKEHGRVYRLVYTGGKLSPKLDLAKASPQELVAALGTDNLLWRKHAQRLLVERANKDVVPALVALVKDNSVDEIGLNDAATHALWTLHGLGALDGSDEVALAAAVGALKHPSAGVRRNAVRVLPHTDAMVKALLEGKALADADPFVRLQSLLAIADAPAGAISEQVAGAIYAMLQKRENSADRWIPDAAVAAAAKHDAAFLKVALENSKKDLPPAPKEDPKPAPAVNTTPVNLIQNPSLEKLNGGNPEQWRGVTYNGQATFAVDSAVARTGSTSVRIVSERGADASWSQNLAVKPNTRYRFSAWVKTQNFKKGSGHGALLNIHQLQSFRSNPVTEDKDWTALSVEFSTGNATTVQLNLLYGGWGRATGTAWFDDVEVVELGPGKVSLAAGPSSTRLGRIGDIAKLVSRHYAERAPADSVVATLASLEGADRELAAAVLDGLVAGWPTEAPPKLADADRARLGELAKALPADQRDRLLVLARRWGQSDIFAGQMEEVLKTVKATLTSKSASAADRADAARRLIRLSDNAASISAIIAQLTPQLPNDTAAGLVGAITESKLDEAGAMMIKKWADLPPAARKAAIPVLMRRSAWTLAMLEAIKEKKLLRGELTASDWQVLKSHKEKAVASLATKLDQNVMDPDRQKVLATMLPALEKPGDVALGAKLYTARCAQCHIFNGQGGKVGPELSGIGARDPKEVLADIVDPNRSVEANFRMWMVDTEDGDSYSGRLDTETQTSVEILDATGQRHVIQRKDIATMTASQLSVMPVGLIDDLKPEEISALIEHLKTGHAPEKK